MKTFFASLAILALLTGCPDTRVPKDPGTLPTPKAGAETPRS